MLKRVALFVGLLLVAMPCRWALVAATPPGDNNQTSTATEIRLMDPGWWPTKGTFPRDQYVGSQACGRCHQNLFETQSRTPMAHALTSADASSSLKDFPRVLHFHTGGYEYEFDRSASGLEYKVNNGQQSAAVPLNWIFGDRQFGDTFLYQQSGIFYESRLSYYTTLNALDFTTGSPRFPPNRIETALGRRMSPGEPPLCFGCHSTASSTDGEFHSERLIPGVGCESCHGPGAQHIAQMSLPHDNQSPTLTFNPARLRPADSVDFCGACHRTSVDVSLSGASGILTLRFPAYRLQRSRCWGQNGDARLTCIACHDTHKPRVTDAAFYDKGCLSCHAVQSSSKKHKTANKRTACPVSDHTCVECHMPKYFIPEMHTSFTDHKIAVHRKEFSE